jgi:hypothetical protein
VTKIDALRLMAIFKAAYPAYYRDIPESEHAGIANLWAEMLEPYPAELATFAAKRLIAENKFPPAISDVISRVKEALGAGRDGAAEAWAALHKAAGRASIVTKAEFDALPYEARRFCGGLSGLAELGMIDSAVFNTVTRGQFLKLYEGLRRARETIDAMPPEVLALVREITKPMPEPGPPAPGLAPKQPEGPGGPEEAPGGPAACREPAAYEPLEPGEWEERRGKMLALLEQAAGRPG